MSEPKTLLLIGARGFAGRHLRAAAEEAGLRVVGTSRSGDGAEAACDLLDPDAVEPLLRKVRPDLVANLAGAASVAESWRHPRRTFTLNAWTVVNLLDSVAAAAPEAQVAVVSSAEVYGASIRAEALPVDEELPLAPLSPYGASKAAMEQVCGQYRRSRGVRVAVLRSFNQLGPGQEAGYAASDFARQIAAAERAGAGEAEVSVGNLSAARDFVDVRDAARAFLAIWEHGLTGTYNLCSGEPVAIRSLIEHLADATELPVRPVADPDLARPVEVDVVYGSPARLREATGWGPRIPLARSLADVLDWWRQADRAERAA